jgi:hypothetical protein
MESLTGDPSTDALVPADSALVWAVKNGDTAEVSRVLNEQHGYLYGLLVVMAAMVPDDQTPAELLSWQIDRERYLALREQGIDSATAMAMIRAA